MTGVAQRIYVSDPVKAYLVDTVEATRQDPDLLLGASPRATLFLQRTARTRAAVEGRHYVTPDDVKAVLRPVLTHRMILRPEAQMRGASVEEIIQGIAHGVPVPGTRTRV
jgi:MoxR-like ATPase